ncbi:MAG: hypothetical protein IPG10_19160 [Flavobacteriales bacterium]|nr:hypothetical protein [Flavobacteriales bacterium]
MWRLAILLVPTSFSFLAHGQIWCAPGATWDFSIQALSIGGYVHREYTGDTVVGGRTQVIEERGYIINYLQGGSIDTISATHFTNVEDSIVYYWIPVNGIETWDTLFRMDAQLGDRWFPPGFDTSYCQLGGLEGMLMVTGMYLWQVDGYTLRSFVLDYVDMNGQPNYSAGSYSERSAT